jgi:hypothetical protein
MPYEFEKHLDFWLKGQKLGFAGVKPVPTDNITDAMFNLTRKKLPDGSKIVALREHPHSLSRLYVDRWYGSDMGGGQTTLYILTSPWNPEKPLDITGTPIARLGYSGQIVQRIHDKDLNEYLEAFNITQSEMVWKVLKSALSKVSKDRPFRGPEQYVHPFPHWVYQSKEEGDMNRTVGHEFIRDHSSVIFKGNYDFTLIKQNLEDALL